MAGNSENPEPQRFHAVSDELRVAAVPPARRIKSFLCKSCGMPVNLRNPGESLTVVCSGCKSIIDARDENYGIIQRFSQLSSRYTAEIPLGTQGELFGKKWEAIGFIVRQEDSSGFIWYEYLLFNPYYGYRWLVKVSGHWSFACPLKDKLEPDTDGRGQYVDYKGARYRVFNSGTASILFVLGEFYWRLKVDSKLYLSDFINPPYILSQEVDGREVNWSLGEYVEPQIIETAFRLKPGLISRGKIGVGAIQLNPDQPTLDKVIRYWLLFALVLTVLQFWQLLQIGKNECVLTQIVYFIPNTKGQQTFTSKPFELKKNLANLKIRFDAPVSNSWVYVSGELVNIDTGTTYPFERTIEQYSGYTDGEAWTEGSPQSELLLSSIPGGKYYLDVDYESGMYQDTLLKNFTMQVVRDVPTYANYFWCLAFISIMPIWTWLSSRQFEVKRWSNSDFSPYQSLESE